MSSIEAHGMHQSSSWKLGTLNKDDDDGDDNGDDDGDDNGDDDEDDDDGMD